MNIPPLARSARLLALLLLACGPAWRVRAQTTLPAPSTDESAAAARPVALERVVISASRTPQDARYTPSSVSAVPLAALEAAQITTLREALAQQPGVILYTNGGAGSLSTILLRGANAHQTLFVVDGVRMNDRSSTFQNFLGGSDLGGIDRIEVLRGPQSTLYGSSAMGGVILMETTRGAGPAGGAISAMAGSFETYGASASVAGAAGRLGYSAALSRAVTDNDRPDNEFERWSYSTRLDFAATAALTIGATFRRQDSEYAEPGSRLFPSPGKIDFSNDLATVYAQATVGETFTSRLTLASHLRDYVYRSSYGDSPVQNRRRIADWQNTWEATSRVQIVAGANYEKSRFTVSGAPSTDRVAAGYVSAVVRATDQLTLTGGGRQDDFKSVGSATTGRGGVAWRPLAGTKLRATFGSGFAAPGSDDVYGVPSYGQLPNPDLLPETSRGWDVGVDQEFAGGRATVALTYFQNKFRELFDWETVDFVTYEGRTINRARASSEGVELAVAARLGANVRTRASYTHLEAKDDLSGARLIRRPRHTGDVEVTWQATPAWLVGAGVHAVADRMNGTVRMEDYTSMRVFGSWSVRADLALKLRVENALDERYEEIFGYPALPLGAFGSVEWRF